MAGDASGPAVSTGPVPFTSDDGHYFLIPLSAVSFDSSGKATLAAWPLYNTYKTALDLFLPRLLTAGVIQKGPVPPAKPALKATAVTPGASGVAVEMTFANVTPNVATPPASTANVTVKETDTYAGIALAKLVETIGNAANGGTRPGLVFVSGPAPTEMPQNGDYDLAIAAPGSAAKVDVTKTGGGGTAFTLQARSADAAGDLINAKISDANNAAKTFTLTVTWNKPVNGAAISTLANQFAFVVKIDPPPGGYRAPVAGKVTLAGGQDAVSLPAVKATAIVPSAS